MPSVSKPFTFSAGAVIIASQHNSCFDTLYNLVNGTLDGTNLASNAAIADTQLAAITTAGKVAGGAITLASTSIVTAATNDYAFIGDTSDSGNPKKALVSDFAYTPTAANALSGSIIQAVITQSSAVASSTGTAVDDDTIPTLTECPVITALNRTITAGSGSNNLIITANLNVQLGATTTCIASLFLDAGSAAIASVRFSNPESTRPFSVMIQFSVSAVDTSSHTYKIGVGGVAATVVTINGSGGSRLLGGVLYSSLKIEEVKA